MSQILSNKEAFATPLLLYAYHLIGDDIFDLEPETIEQILKQHDHKVLKRNLERINAALGLITTNLFWQDPVTFAVTCRTFARVARVEAAPPDLDDVVWAITEARLIIGNPKEDPEPFSDSIKAYIEHLMKLDGVVTVEPTLDFITPPEISNEYDDPDQATSIYANSEENVEELERTVSTKMIMLLKQIKDLNIKLSEEASKDLEKLLKER